MAKNMNYSDASNTSVRTFLTQAGIEYDKRNGFESLNGKNGYDSHRIEVFKFQKSCCFYCDAPLTDKIKIDRDHVIPMNRDFGGIHCWGNVVYCCSSCNSEKHYYKNGDWKNYLEHIGKIDIYLKWIARYPNGQKESLQLVEVCKEIYDHVGSYLREQVSELNVS